MFLSIVSIHLYCRRTHKILFFSYMKTLKLFGTKSHNHYPSHVRQMTFIIYLHHIIHILVCPQGCLPSLSCVGLSRAKLEVYLQPVSERRTLSNEAWPTNESFNPVTVVIGIERLLLSQVCLNLRRWIWTQEYSLEADFSLISTMCFFPRRAQAIPLH